MTTVVSKQPGEARILAFQFADALADGATLASITSVTPTSEGLITGSSLVTLGSPVIVGTDVRVLVSGGTDREGYRLACLVVDSNGQTLEADASLFVLAEPATAALVVEDGTGLATANSYVTVAEADAYLRLRGRAATWDTYSPDAKAGHLVAATDYLDAMSTWRGQILTSTQALGWPRGGALDKWGRFIVAGTVPRLVKTATIEIASLGEITREGGPAVTRKVVGPIEIEYDTAQDQSVGRARYKLAFDLVASLATNGATTIGLVRS